MNTTYPQFLVIHDTSRPVRIVSERSVPEGATQSGSWEPFLDVDALLEDADYIDESDFDAAIAKWKGA